MKQEIKPSAFTKFPMGSTMQKSEAETIARNIMVILARTGDTFRLLTWDEYKTEREKDANFSTGERAYFDVVIDYCKSADTARLFSPVWEKAFTVAEVPNTPEPAPKKIIEIKGKKGEYTGFSNISCCHHFSMYDGSVIKLSELETIKLFGVDFVTPSHTYNQPTAPISREDEGFTGGDDVTYSPCLESLLMVLKGGDAKIGKGGMAHHDLIHTNEDLKRLYRDNVRLLEENELQKKQLAVLWEANDKATQWYETFKDTNDKFIETAKLLIKAQDDNKDLLQMVKDLKNCVSRLCSDNATQYLRDAEAEWIGEAHELLNRLNK